MLGSLGVLHNAVRVGFVLQILGSVWHQCRIEAMCCDQHTD
jgi:hypothetical protein